jgi:ABC-type transporter Mla MlaB component
MRSLAHKKELERHELLRLYHMGQISRQTLELNDIDADEINRIDSINKSTLSVFTEAMRAINAGKRKIS